MLDRPTFTISNVRSGDVVSYPLVLFDGQLHGASAATSVTVSRIGADRPRLRAYTYTAPSQAWPVARDTGVFKALVFLAPGENVIEFRAGGEPAAATHRLVVHYLNAPWDYCVRAVYVVPADDPVGGFQAPPHERCDIDSAVHRLALAMRLLQSALAELMHRHGLGRYTFCLEEPAQARACPSEGGYEEVLVAYGVPVHVHRFKHSQAALQALSGDELYDRVGHALRSAPDRESRIDVALMSFTRKDAHTGKLYGHTALGGGRLALFGSGSMFSWPENLEQVPRRFTDRTAVDGRRFLDDSAGRGEYWALASTSMGAVLHELGHCLSLPHPHNGGGVMARGFDYLYRLFVVAEPQPGAEMQAPDEPRLDRSAAARLRFHSYLIRAGSEPHPATLYPPHPPPAPDGAVSVPVPSPSPTPTPPRPRLYVATNGLPARARAHHEAHSAPRRPSITWQSEGVVRVSAPNGLGHVGYYLNGDVAAHEEFFQSSAPVHLLDIPWHEVCRQCGNPPAGAKIRISCVDHAGQIEEAFERQVGDRP